MATSTLVQNTMGENNAIVVDREILEDDTIVYTLPYECDRVILNVPDDVTADELRRLLEGIGAFARDDWRYERKLIFQYDLDPSVHRDLINTLESYIEDYLPVKYEDLLDRLGEEKRVTLRVPMGLHTMLVSASKGKSLNTFCMEVLSKAVGFEGIPVASATKKD